MSDVKVSSGPAISFIGLLTIVLVVLKALGYLTWSWWLVFTPLIISVSLGILLIIGILFIALQVAKDDDKYDKTMDKLCAKYNGDWEQDKRFK